MGLPLGQPRQHHVPETCSAPQSHCLKAPAVTQGRPGGFWSQGCELRLMQRRSWGVQMMPEQLVPRPSSSCTMTACAVLDVPRTGFALTVEQLQTPLQGSPSPSSPPSSATFASKPSVPPAAHGQSERPTVGAAQAPPELECTEGPRGHDLPLGSSSARSKITNKKEPLAIVSRGRG